MIFTPVLASFLTGLLTTLFVIVCIFLILVILIQKPRGGGLTGAFGGAGGNASSVFGSKTGDVLTWFTVVCFTLFIGLAMALTWTAKPTRVDVIQPVVAPTGTGDGTVDGIPGVNSAKDFNLIPDGKKDGTAIEPTTKDGTTPAPVPVPVPAPAPAKDATTPAPAPTPAPTPETPAKDAK